MTLPTGAGGGAVPARGEVWLLDLNPTRGREQAGTRPALVISVDGFNQGPADLIVVLPITANLKGFRCTSSSSRRKGDCE